MLYESKYVNIQQKVLKIDWMFISEGGEENWENYEADGDNSQ